MSDQEDIRNLISRYSLAANDGDIETYQSLFARDGELVESGVPFSRAMLPLLSGAYHKARSEQPQPYGGKHIQANTWIEITGANEARAMTDIVVLRIRPETGWTIGNKGRYTDDFVREDGTWRFRRRSVTWDHELPADPNEQGFYARVKELIDEAMSAKADS
nr:nuclear transport factor 2 family protein [Sphingomonas sp. CDS-1]